MGFGLGFKEEDTTFSYDKLDDEAKSLIKELEKNALDRLDILREFSMLPDTVIGSAKSVLASTTMLSDEIIGVLECFEKADRFNRENSLRFASLAVTVCAAIRTCLEMFPLITEEKKGENNG